MSRPAGGVEDDRSLAVIHLELERALSRHVSKPFLSARFLMALVRLCRQYANAVIHQGQEQVTYLRRSKTLRPIF